MNVKTNAEKEWLRKMNGGKKAKKSEQEIPPMSTVPTEEMMEDYCSRIKAPFDSCMVHENIPADLLPILYYDGDSDCVLLATAKDKRRKGSLSPRYMKYSIQIS